MKRLFAMIAAVVALVVAAPLAAHHAAEGIVSDEIYAKITQLLEDADSPHLDLDLTDIMDPDDGTVMGTAITLTVTGPLTADELDAILEEIQSIVDAATDLPLPGQGGQVGSADNFPAVEIIVDDEGPGPTTITIEITGTAGEGRAV
jgi:hypothetical protein